MSAFESFVNFYHSLNGSGVVVVWIFLFLFVFFVIATIGLIIRNRTLTKILEEKMKIEEEHFVYQDEEVKVPVSTDSVSVQALEEDSLLKDVKVTPEIVKAVPNVEPIISVPVIEKTNEPVSEIKESIAPADSVAIEAKKEEVYRKNILKDNTMRFQTSPIHIVHEKSIDETMQKLKPEVIEEDLSLVKNVTDFATSQNINFVEELSRKMESEVKPQTIELTDYELKQEEEAIISYEELLQNKDRLFNLIEDEDDECFIEELKSFRNSLQ